MVVNGIGVMEFPHVLLEVEIATKSFVTNRTLKGFLFVMGVHVEGQVVDLVEGFIAYVTFIRFFARMREFMILIVAFLVKTFATKLAYPRFVSLMDSNVSIQRRRSVKKTKNSCIH